MTSTNETLNEFFSDFAEKKFPLKCSKCGLEYEDTGRNLINLKERLERKQLTTLQITELVSWLELTLKDEGVIYCYCPKCREDKEFEKFNESIPDRYRNLHTDRKEELKENHDKSIYVYGPSGTGKTVFAIDVARKNYIEDNIPLLFVDYHKFVLDMQATFKSQGKSPYKMADKVADFRGLVILDGVNPERLSDFAKQMTYHIISERAEYLRQTIITSIYSAENLSVNIDPQLLSKIKSSFARLHLTEVK